MVSLLFSKFLRVAALGLSVFLGAAASANAQPYVYTTGHGDFRVSYDSAAQEFIPHIRLDGGATYRENEVLIWTDVSRETVANNTTSIANFSGMLGITAGETIWVLGGSGVGPYLGFSGEGLTSADWVHTFPNPYTGDPFTGSAIHIELTGWSMPAEAQFGLYQTSGLPATWGNRANGDIVFSTYDPDFTFNNNKLSIIVGDHTHYAFGFTKPGDYHLELTFSSIYQGITEVSTPATFTFRVVPEPSAGLLVGVAALGLTFGRRYFGGKK